MLDYDLLSVVGYVTFSDSFDASVLVNMIYLVQITQNQF
jgi:hypothetical protein